MAKSSWRNTKYIIILTERQLSLLQSQVMTEFGSYTDECDPSTRKVYNALKKQIDERIEV